MSNKETEGQKEGRTEKKKGRIREAEEQSVGGRGRKNEKNTEKQRVSQNMEARAQSLLLFLRARHLLGAPPLLLSNTEAAAQPLITIPRIKMWASHLKTSTWFFTK